MPKGKTSSSALRSVFTEKIPVVSEEEARKAAGIVLAFIKDHPLVKDLHERMERANSKLTDRIETIDPIGDDEKATQAIGDAAMEYRRSWLAYHQARSVALKDLYLSGFNREKEGETNHDQ